MQSRRSDSARPACVQRYDKTNPLLSLLDEAGRVRRWPSPRRPEARAAILAYLAEQFVPGRSYDQQETLAIIQRFHLFDQSAMILEALCEQGWLLRVPQPATYRRPPA